MSFLRERITVVTKGLKLSSSKRTKIWSEFHIIQMDNSGEMKSSWKKLLLSLDMSNSDLEPLLEKSIYREVFDRLVAEYFNSSSAIVNQELPSMDVQLTSDELNAM